MIVIVPFLQTEKKSDEDSLSTYIPKLDGKEMSFEDYLHFKSEEPTNKYEWNNCFLEAEETMKPQEMKIYRNLHSKFIKDSKLAETYEMITEVETHLMSQKKVRIPDIGIFLHKDIQSYEVGKSFFPVVAIEIISPSNSIEEMETKIMEYFTEGVQMFWCILPKLRQVKIYHSSKQITTCSGEEICDMKNVLPFSITIKELFQDF